MIGFQLFRSQMTSLLLYALFHNVKQKELTSFTITFHRFICIIRYSTLWLHYEDDVSECPFLLVFLKVTIFQVYPAMQSRIDRKNEEIDHLKIGLSGITKRYGFYTVHDFYKAYDSSKEVYVEYQGKVDKQEKVYGENAQELK